MFLSFYSSYIVSYVQISIILKQGMLKYYIQRVYVSLKGMSIVFKVKVGNLDKNDPAAHSY